MDLLKEDHMGDINWLLVWDKGNGLVIWGWGGNGELVLVV